MSSHEHEERLTVEREHQERNYHRVRWFAVPALYSLD